MLSRVEKMEMTHKSGRDTNEESLEKYLLAKRINRISGKLEELPGR
jgi:hypothetical protein